MVCVNGLKFLVDSWRPTWRCCVLMRAPFVVAVADGSKFKPQSLSFCWPLLPLLQVEPFGLSDQSQAVAVKMDAQVVPGFQKTE